MCPRLKMKHIKYKSLNDQTRLHQPFDIGDVEKVLLLEDRVQYDCGVHGLEIVDE